MKKYLLLLFLLLGFAFVKPASASNGMSFTAPFNGQTFYGNDTYVESLFGTCPTDGDNQITLQPLYVLPQVAPTCDCKNGYFVCGYQFSSFGSHTICAIDKDNTAASDCILFTLANNTYSTPANTPYFNVNTYACDPLLGCSFPQATQSNFNYYSGDNWGSYTASNLPFMVRPLGVALNATSTRLQVYELNNNGSTGSQIDQQGVGGSNGGSVAFGTTGNIKVAQQFTPTNKNFSGVTFRRQGQTGTPTTITISLQIDSSGSPSGTALSSYTITSAQWLTIPLVTDYFVPMPYDLSSYPNGTKFWIVFADGSSAGDNSNYYSITYRYNGAAPAPYSAGNMKVYTAGAWASTWNPCYTANTCSVYFQTWYTTASTNYSIKTTLEDNTLNNLTFVDGGRIYNADYTNQTTHYFMVRVKDEITGAIYKSLQFYTSYLSSSNNVAPVNTTIGNQYFQKTKDVLKTKLLFAQFFAFQDLITGWSNPAGNSAPTSFTAHFGTTRDNFAYTGVVLNLADPTVQSLATKFRPYAIALIWILFVIYCYTRAKTLFSPDEED